MGSTVSRKSYLFTSESVSEGHPDKVCDASRRGGRSVLPRGSEGRHRSLAAAGCLRDLATTNQVVIAGETRGPRHHHKDWVAHVARMAIKDIGYEQDGFHWDKSRHQGLLHPQSADIAQGVDSGGNRRRGRRPGHHVRPRLPDTPELMPAPIYYSHKILRLISEARHSGKEAVLGPTPRAR
jgi:S-adenosylmethionine synthetase